MPKLTVEQALVIMGYTGIVCADFALFHKDVEKRLGYSVFTHQMADPALVEQIRLVYKKDFFNMLPDEVKPK